MPVNVSMQFGKPSGTARGGSTTQTLTPTITKTSGNSSVNSITAARYGNVVFLTVEFIVGNAVNAGSNAFVGTISDIPLPGNNAVGLGYYGSAALVSAITATGEMTVRVLAAQKPASSTNTYRISWTYVCS